MIDRLSQVLLFRPEDVQKQKVKKVCGTLRPFRLAQEGTLARQRQELALQLTLGSAMTIVHELAARKGDVA